MATPLRAHRLSRGSAGHFDSFEASDSSAYSSPFVRSSSASTPYALYKAREGAASHTPRSPFLPTRSSIESPGAAHHGYSSGGGEGFSSSLNSPVRRKSAVQASPGVRSAKLSTVARSAQPVPSASQGYRPAKKGRVSRAFVRRRTLQQRVKDLPADLVDYANAAGLTLSEYMHDPTLGYPLGVGLHFLSLVSHLISPASDLSLSALITGIDTTNQEPSLFASSNGAARHRPGSLREVRRAAQRHKANLWSWAACLLSLILVALSLCNAYILLMSRRRYRLWFKSPEDKVASKNAKLVPIHLDDETCPPSLQERLGLFLLERLHRVPLLSWFLPDLPANDEPGGLDAQIHELNVWEAPDVPLRIVIAYSPLHALLWHFAGTFLLPISGPVAWLAIFALMAGMSAQAYLLSLSFEGLVKDRALLAAEVMREYDEKFVLPRAMPTVRDVSTMTEASVSTSAGAGVGACGCQGAEGDGRDDSAGYWGAPRNGRGGTTIVADERGPWRVVRSRP